MKEFFRMLEIVIALFVILWILFTFIIGLKMVPNDDMSPRLNAGDIMLYYRIDKTINSQDVIVVKKNNTEYVGRVIAKGGDTVEIKKEGNLIVNGNLVTESNIFYTTKPYEGFVKYPLKLKPDECFVLSDRRNSGEDSRYYGAVKKNEIVGTVIGLYRRAKF